MGQITIEGIKVYAYHGHLPEESVLGGHFIVNVWIDFDSSKVVKSDNLEDTVDYVEIIEIVKHEMKTPSKMIEHPAKRIINKILLLKRVMSVKVEVEKIQPPVNAQFKKISVTFKEYN